MTKIVINYAKWQTFLLQILQIQFSLSIIAVKRNNSSDSYRALFFSWINTVNQCANVSYVPHENPDK
jgi:hypothetical protein